MKRSNEIHLACVLAFLTVTLMHEGLLIHLPSRQGCELKESRKECLENLTLAGECICSGEDYIHFSSRDSTPVRDYVYNLAQSVSESEHLIKDAYSEEAKERSKRRKYFVLPFASITALFALSWGIGAVTGRKEKYF